MVCRQKHRVESNDKPPFKVVKKIMDIPSLGVKATLANGGWDSSLGTTAHGQQVAPDRHQATVCNIAKQPLKIGSWKVRSLYQSGKLDNVKQEITRL